MRVPEGSHQHAFWVRLQDENPFQRDETYVTNLSPASELDVLAPGPGIVYTRRR